MIRLMSDCLLRISEVVAVNVEDIGKVLTVRSSKTDQEGEGTALYVGAPTHKAIRKYRKAAGIEEGALFRRVRWQKHITPDRLSVNGARNAIKRRGCRSRRGRFHLRTLASCGICGVSGSGGGVGGRYADGGQMEESGDAGALCEGGTVGTGRGCKIQIWQMRVSKG